MSCHNGGKMREIIIFIVVIELIIWIGLSVSSMSEKKPEKRHRRG